MDNKFKLRKAIKGIEELNFAFDKLSAIDYKTICRIERKMNGLSVDALADSIIASAGTRKTSSEFRIACAWVAAVKGTDGLAVDVYDQLSLDDLLELLTFGLLFFVGSLEWTAQTSKNSFFAPMARSGRFRWCSIHRRRSYCTCRWRTSTKHSG